MRIKWFGHSAFEIFSENTSIWIDPFFTGNPFAPNWRDQSPPDLILVTHDHNDHLGDTIDILKETNAEVLSLADICYSLPALGVSHEKILFGGNGMNIGGTIEYKGFKITMTNAVHSSVHGVPTGFVISDPEGKTVYHAGDTALFGDMAYIAERYVIDVALLPIGGHFTMDAIDASKACQLVEAKAVIPMHYGTFPIIAQNTDEFRDQLKVFSPQTTFIYMDAGEMISI